MTEQNYEITIPREYGHIEDYASADDNIARFTVFDKQGNDISDQVMYITIFLSKNAMLGLGTELIRLAHNFEEDKEVHIIPTSKEKGAQQSMGIFLTPESCELIIKCESFEPIDTILEEYKKKQA